MFSKLSQELPPDSIIVSGRKISDKISAKIIPLTSTRSQLFVNNGAVKIPMSWSSNSTIYFYIISK